MDEVEDANRAYFDDPGIVGTYEEEGLTPAEEDLFGRFLRPGSDVLDLGVGAGRTIPALRGLGGRYVGVDFAPEMVETCHRRFPGVDVREGDAADLSAFDDASFDAVVFSFNGIDCLHPVAERRRCLAEVRRVLRADGVAILSSHNVHACIRPIEAGPGLAARVTTLAKQGFVAGRIVSRTVRGGAVLRGEGYVRDPATPLVLYMTSRDRFAREAHAAGLRLAAVVGSDHPSPPSALRSAWFYFALRPA